MGSKNINLLEPGFLLHWYRIDAMLGQGGFGITYLAEDQNLLEKVAIKEYYPSQFATRTEDGSVQELSEEQTDDYKWGLDRFISEARTLTQFRHNSIVRVRNVFEDNNTAYMVMDYEEGATLADKLKGKHTLPEQALLALILPLMEGLEVVHKAGFIHRDIKPANIVVKDNRAVLIDFGAARQAVGERSVAMTQITSAGYAPFEQYQSKGDRQGPWTDIYAVGATMYRAVTGVTPSQALDRSNALLETSRDTYISVREFCGDDYSESFISAIDHALMFRPEDRPQSVSEWRTELEGGGRAFPDSEAPTGVTLEDTGEQSVIEGINIKGILARLQPYQSRLAIAGILLLAILSFFIYERQPDTQDITASEGETALSDLEQMSKDTEIQKQAEPFTPRSNSLVVIPLRNLGNDEEDAYFAAGLTEDLTNTLAGIDGFWVASQTSARYFEDRNDTSDTIGKMLNVANILTGSVRKAGNQIRVSLQLTNTMDGSQFWSQTYDRESSDLFKIQSDIATAVAKAMQVTILGDEQAKLDKPPTTSVEAHEILQLAWKGNNFEHALKLTDQAIALDPDYAEAYLSRGFAFVANFNYTGQPSVHIVLEEADKALKKAEDLLENPGATSHTYNYLKAMKLRRQLWMGNYGDVDMEREMEQAFQQAIKLNPSDTMPYISFSSYYMKKHEVRKAEDLMRQALNRDPLHLNALQFYSRVLSMQGKFDESLQWAKRVVEYYQEGYHIVAYRYQEIDRFGEAISWILQNNYQLHLYGKDVANNYMALGDRENARYWKEQQWMKPEEKGNSKLNQAYALMLEGKYDDAYELAHEAVTESGATAWWVLNEPAEWALLAGRYADAIRYYEQAFPNLRDPLRPDVNILNMGGALDLAFALNQSGEEGRAGILFGLILNLVENKNRIGHNSFGITDVYVYASLGQTDRALKALREAIDAGWRSLYRTSSGRILPMLNSLKGNPDFESMVAEVDADLSAQRQQLAENLTKQKPKS